MEKLEKQPCPMCHKNTLTLTEAELDIPYFDKVFVFSMNCSSCSFKKSDIEAAERHEPCKCTIETTSEDDMKIRVVRSSEATVKIPTLRMSSTPGPASVGQITNIEGIINTFESIVESQRDEAEEPSAKKTAKNLLKKIRKVKYGDIPCKIVIEDPSGNSAIVSEKVVKEKLKVK